MLISFTTRPLSTSRQGLIRFAIPMRIYDTPIAVFLAMTIVSIPIATGSLVSALSQLSPDFEVVARSSGSTRGWYIITVLPRIIMKPLIVAFLLSWARAFSETGSLLVLARRPLTVGVYIYESFLVNGVTSIYVASAASLIIGVSIFWLGRWLASRSL